MLQVTSVSLFHENWKEMNVYATYSFNKKYNQSI